MPQILFVHSSANFGDSKKECPGSYTRQMARELKTLLRSRGARFVDRDVAQHPPRLIDSAFISAAMTAEEQRTPEQVESLTESDELVSEVLLSDVIVVGCPIYNFGVPAPLKAWIDNIVRLGKTYTIDDQRTPHVIYGLLHTKKIILLASSGSKGLCAGGSRQALNHGDTSVRAIFEQLGVRHFDEVFFEGANEDPPEVLEHTWNKCVIELQGVAERIEQRWKEL